jgi:hypothetical protein
VETLAAIDYSVLTDGLVSAFESGVTTGLPVAAAVTGAFLVIKAIRRIVKA